MSEFILITFSFFYFFINKQNMIKINNCLWVTLFFYLVTKLIQITNYRCTTLLSEITFKSIY